MKKTIKKRAFISAIAMLIVSAIVLTSSTFAWFSMAKKVEVEAMNLSITSPEGIQLSANATAWTTKLTAAELKGEAVSPYERFNAYEGNTNHLLDTNEYLSPATSALMVSSGFPTWYTGSIDADGMLNITKVTSDTANDSPFVCFDLFVKLAEDKKVMFDSSTVTCATNAETVYAMKMAVINCGQVIEGADIANVKPSSQTTYIAGLGSKNNAVMYEFNALNHTIDSGVENGTADINRNTFNKAGTITPAKATDSSANAVLMPNGSSYAAGIEAQRASKDVDPSGAYFNARAGITKIRVYLYVDGQDCDCANDIAGNDITFNFVLTIA